jgi:hypothetical protein
MWLGVVFSFIYFTVGDFFTGDFIDEEKGY